MPDITFTNFLPHHWQLAASHISMQDLLSTGCSCLPEPVVDHECLKRDYPWLEFIGLIGFDTHRQEFVLLAVGHPTRNISDKRGLSEREQEVLQLVVEGCTNAQIAQKLVISENTVKAHMQSIFAKLKVRSRTQAAMLATQQG